MKIKNIKLPYPVLGLSDDITPLPKFEIKKTSDKMKYTFDISFTVENPDIKKLIDEGYAQYVCEIDCIGTYLRISKTSKVPRFEIEIKRREVMGTISFTSSTGWIQPKVSWSRATFTQTESMVSEGTVLMSATTIRSPLRSE